VWNLTTTRGPHPLLLTRQWYLLLVAYGQGTWPVVKILATCLGLHAASRITCIVHVHPLPVFGLLVACALRKLPLHYGGMLLWGMLPIVFSRFNFFTPTYSSWRGCIFIRVYIHSLQRLERDKRQNLFKFITLIEQKYRGETGQVHQWKRDIYKNATSNVQHEITWQFTVLESTVSGLKVLDEQRQFLTGIIERKTKKISY
jgi:hypothetical protein